MSSFFNSTAEKILSLFGYDQPTSTELLLGKIAIVGGVIGVSTIIALIPVTLSLEKEIKIKKSGKEVYNFLSQTPTNKLWPQIHPLTVSAEVREGNNNTEHVMMTDEVEGRKYPFIATIVKHPHSQTIVLDTEITINPFIYDIPFKIVMQVIDESNTECKCKSIITEAVPLFMIPKVKRLLNIVWGNGAKSVPSAIKDAVEN